MNSKSINSSQSIYQFQTRNFLKYPGNLQIIDLITVTDSFKSCIYIEIELKCSITVLKYNSLLTAIPPYWKNKINSQEFRNAKIKNINIPTILIGDSLKTINKLKSKQLYTHLVTSKTTIATALEKWVESYPFMNNVDWEKIYSLPYTVTKNTYFQTFQFKILSRILNCRDKLSTWSIVVDNKCPMCNIIDTIEHHLYECSISSMIWTKLQNWLQTSLDIQHCFTLCEVIFGILDTNIKEQNIINFVILITKNFINNKKTKEEDIYFIELLSLLKDTIQLMLVQVNKEDINQDDTWIEKLNCIL